MGIQNGLKCIPYKDSRKRHTYIYTKGQFVKSVTSGYNLVTLEK
jgi:hypothetical protein